MMRVFKTQEAAKSSMSKSLRLGHSKLKRSFEKDSSRDFGALYILRFKTKKISSKGKGKKVLQLEITLKV